MARRKKRMTTFSKLLLFLLFSTPFLYLGISHLMGQDGIGNIKSAIGLSKKTENTVKSYPAPPAVTAQERDEMYRQIEDMKQRLRQKNQEIKELRNALEQANAQ